MNKPSKDTAVLCASSLQYAFALFTTLKTFLAHSPKLAARADIYVYAYNWDEKAKHIFQTHFPITLIDFDLPSFIPRFPVIQRFTPALFARFEAFALLEKYQNVICLDSDILVQKELQGVLDEVPAGGMGLTPDSCPTVGHNFFATIDGYDFSVPCYNAGFIVLKNPLPGQKIHTWLQQMLARYGERCYLGDQGLINLVLQEFHIQPTPLSERYNLPASRPTNQLKQAYIIHSTGHRKFWSYYYFNDWYNGYAQWQALSGQTAPKRDPVNTPRWDHLLAKTGWNKRVFFQLAPDALRYPGKFLLFALKRTLRLKY